MAQLYQTATRKVDGSLSVSTQQMYYARKRRRARAEATAGRHGGLREQAVTFGVKMTVRLTLQ